MMKQEQPVHSAAREHAGGRELESPQPIAGLPGMYPEQQRVLMLQKTVGNQLTRQMIAQSPVQRRVSLPPVRGLAAERLEDAAPDEAPTMFTEQTGLRSAAPPPETGRSIQRWAPPDAPVDIANAENMSGVPASATGPV